MSGGPARRLVVIAVGAVVLAHYIVPFARELRPLLEGAALLAIIALAFWFIVIARVRNRIDRGLW
jgi:hypothetical protein